MTTVFSSEAPSAKPAGQALDVGQEAEGARAGQFAAERGGVEIENLALAADHLAVEIDFDFEAEALVGGAQLGEGAALVDPDRSSAP